MFRGIDPRFCQLKLRVKFSRLGGCCMMVKGAATKAGSYTSLPSKDLSHKIAPEKSGQQQQQQPAAGSSATYFSEGCLPGLIIKAYRTQDNMVSRLPAVSSRCQRRSSCLLPMFPL